MAKSKEKIKVKWHEDTGPCDLDSKSDITHGPNENGYSIDIGKCHRFLCERHALELLRKLTKSIARMT